MKTSKGFVIPLLILAIVILVTGGIYIYLQGGLKNNDQVVTVVESTPVTTNGKCGLIVSSVSPNDTVNFPLNITGEIDNTSSSSTGCSWTMFEGQAGTAQLYFNYNNLSWEKVGPLTPISVENWTSEKTSFSVKLSFDTKHIEIATSTKLKVIFTEENSSGIPSSDTYELPLIFGGIVGTTSENLMALNLYVQDKEIAKISDCGVTKKITVQVPKTSAVADASLKVLFSGELLAYGVYKSVSVSGGVAKVMLTSDNIPSGQPIGSLSSCESSHLMSVLKDTLTQYPTIKSVEIYSPKGKIEF